MLLTILQLIFGLILIATFVWALIILAIDGEWDAISTISTILLAIAAFWVIWQNDEFRKRDKSEKVYNEIQDWAYSGLKFVTRYRGNTRGDQFPKVWEAVAVLSYLSTKNFEKSVKDNKLSEVVKKARENLVNCLSWYHDGGPVNQITARAMQCENSFIELFKELNRLIT